VSSHASSCVCGELICSVPVNHIRAEGKIKNVNTIEDFKNLDKAAILQTAAKQVRYFLLVCGFMC
jgi:hypothetical protein